MSSIQIPKHPLARTTELICEELSGECVIYDSRQKKVHRLNPTMTWIWQACTGTANVEAMAEKFERQFNVTGGTEIVPAALHQLESLDLLERPTDLSDVTSVIANAAVSRRTVLGSSLLLPAVVSILAPTPAAAKSGNNGNGNTGNGNGGTGNGNGNGNGGRG